MVKKVIESWAFLEMLNPGELPNRKTEINSSYIKGNKRFKKVIKLPDKGTSYFELLELSNPPKKEIRYRYYMNTFTNYQLITALRKYFKNNDEIYDRPSNDYFSFSFDVNENHDYIENSLTIPYIQLVINDMQNGDISYQNFEHRYKEKKDRFEEELEAKLLNHEWNPKEITSAFNKYFKLIGNNESDNYIECLIYNIGKAPKSNHLNSFYLQDLQTILRYKENRTLSRFINGTEIEVNIDESRDKIEKILSVENLPLGRWPSPVNHRLSLMQQVAVNHIVQTTELISSVNGPPGTGKTTLLKDIFAQLIVERAMHMVTYSDPTNAFFKTKNSKHTYNLDEAIASYSMVVASCNNGAVENISKELPLKDEIIRLNKPSEKQRIEEFREKGIDPIIFYEYDCAYAEEVKKLNYFAPYAENLLDGEEAWGMFSGAFGKSANITGIYENFKKKENEEISLLEYLQLPLEETAWVKAVHEFNELKEEIEADKKKLSDYLKLVENHEEIRQKAQVISAKINIEVTKSERLTSAVNLLQKEDVLLKERLNNLPPPGFLKKLKRLLTGKQNQAEQEIRQERDSILKKQAEKLSAIDRSSQILRDLEQNYRLLTNALKKVDVQKSKYQHEEITLSTDTFWDKTNYKKRQESVLWQTHELNFKRGLLFLKALQVHKVFLHKNHKHIQKSVEILGKLRYINLSDYQNRNDLKNMWKTLHLIYPVMSTTFASLRTMYKGIGKDFIDYLFIDEAGQASPQQAAGGLWRSKRAIIVGDPLQIEPVVTLDETILTDTRRAFNISDHYIGESASVQSMADYANPIGTYKEIDGEKVGQRIGIPLWVHRRCIEPMFSIANEIAYDGKMVLANNKIGIGKWFNVKGKTEKSQYVPEQGEFIVKHVEQYFENLNINDKPSLFIITPFTAVKSELTNLINTRLEVAVPGIKDWTSNSIGTVHTFQGKEADVVYFVTGTDSATDGAAEWSCMKPNLLNVAVTRAKKEFYVVGDLKRYETKQYYDVTIQKMKHFQELLPPRSIHDAGHVRTRRV